MIQFLIIGSYEMNTIDANREALLSRLTAMANDAGISRNTVQPTESFAPFLKQALDKVSERQGIAADLATKFEQGDNTVNLPQVMVEIQKARISFEALSQVRNKFVGAYQQIMSMPL